MLKNKIGAGAIVQIARSCDVIPDIVKVIKKAKQADMPDTEYEWNETEVDIFSVDEGDNDVCKMKLIGDFFKNISVANLGPGIVKRLYEAGYTEIEDILHISIDDLLGIEGFQDTSAKKLVSNIKKAINSVNLIELMKYLGHFHQLHSCKQSHLHEGLENYIFLKHSCQKDLLSLLYIDHQYLKIFHHFPDNHR